MGEGEKTKMSPTNVAFLLSSQFTGHCVFVCISQVSRRWSSLKYSIIYYKLQDKDLSVISDLRVKPNGTNHQ